MSVQHQKGKEMPLCPKLEIASDRGVLVTVGDPCHAFSPPSETTPSVDERSNSVKTRATEIRGLSSAKFQANPNRTFSKLYNEWSFYYLLVLTISSRDAPM